MPRGGRSRGRAASPVRSSPPRTMASAPPPAPVQQRAPMAQAPQPTAVGQPRQGPGLLGQMATTAAGVAVGSAIGHTIGHAMTGGGGGGGQSQPDVTYQEPPPQQYQQPMQQQQTQPQGYCQFEMKQFLECAQTTQDISLCDGFNQALKDCKFRYGMQ